MAHYVLTSKTEYAGALWRLLEFYHDKLIESQSLPEVKPRDSVWDRLWKAEEDISDRMNRKLDQLERIFAEKVGQRWRPQLRVIQGGGNTTPITRTVIRHKKP